MGKGGQIWLKCITVDLILMIRYKKNIFERVENFHADLAWNYPVSLIVTLVATETIVGSLQFKHQVSLPSLRLNLGLLVLNSQ